jgi:hypothetical protein
MEMINNTEKGIMVPLKEKGCLPKHLPVKAGEKVKIPEEHVKTAKKMGLTSSLKSSIGNTQVETKKEESLETQVDKKKTIEKMTNVQQTDILQSFGVEKIPETRKERTELILEKLSKE